MFFLQNPLVSDTHVESEFTFHVDPVTTESDPEDLNHNSEVTVNRAGDLEVAYVPAFTVVGHDEQENGAYSDHNAQDNDNLMTVSPVEEVASDQQSRSNNNSEGNSFALNTTWNQFWFVTNISQ